MKIMDVRQEVAKFSQEMENQLRLNDFQSDWDKLSNTHLLRRIKEEIIELESSLINQLEINDIKSELGDIGNFLMFMYHNINK